MTTNKLFTDTNDYYKLGHIGWGDTSLQFSGYIEGYKTGADTLVEKAITSGNISILDTLVYPALFLYRQFIELQLKQIILLHSKKSYAEKKDVFKRVGHNLQLAWNEIQPLIETLLEADNSIDEIKELILEFHRFDESSFNFRYPIKKKDLNVVINVSERIDLQVIKNQMDKIDGFFCGVTAMLDQVQASESEMENYYGI